MMLESTEDIRQNVGDVMYSAIACSLLNSCVVLKYLMAFNSVSGSALLGIVSLRAAFLTE